MCQAAEKWLAKSDNRMCVNQDLHSLRTRSNRVLRYSAASTVLMIGLFLQACFLACDRPQPDPENWPQVNEPFPYTRFLDAQGQVIDLKSFQGEKMVVLVVMRGFSGMVCPFCTEQTSQLISHLNDFRGSGAELFLVYPGASETIPRFVEAVKQGMNLTEADPIDLPILLDVDLRAVAALGIEGNLSLPSTFFISRDGNLVFRYIGTSPADRPDTEDLLARLKTMSGEQSAR